MGGGGGKGKGGGVGDSISRGAAEIRSLKYVACKHTLILLT